MCYISKFDIDINHPRTVFAAQSTHGTLKHVEVFSLRMSMCTQYRLNTDVPHTLPLKSCTLSQQEIVFTSNRSARDISLIRLRWMHSSLNPALCCTNGWAVTDETRQGAQLAHQTC